MLPYAELLNSKECDWKLRQICPVVLLPLQVKQALRLPLSHINLHSIPLATNPPVAASFGFVHTSFSHPATALGLQVGLGKGKEAPVKV